MLYIVRAGLGHNKGRHNSRYAIEQTTSLNTLMQNARLQDAGPSFRDPYSRCIPDISSGIPRWAAEGEKERKCEGVSADVIMLGNSQKNPLYTVLPPPAPGRRCPAAAPLSHSALCPGVVGSCRAGNARGETTRLRIGSNTKPDSHESPEGASPFH